MSNTSRNPGGGNPGAGNRVVAAAMQLKFPMSLGRYDEYADAQRAVDHLSDHEFPVENCLIVGTDLKQVERITGRLTKQKVAMGGLLSGLWMGLFVGLVLALFGTGGALGAIVSTMIFGAIFGVVWAFVGYAATQGQRDFTSISRVVATRYEVLVEHKHADQARTLLAEMPDHRPSV